MVNVFDNKSVFPFWNFFESEPSFFICGCYGYEGVARFFEQCETNRRNRLTLTLGRMVENSTRNRLQRDGIRSDLVLVFIGQR